MFAYYKTRGISLLDKLEELYRTFGYCLNSLSSVDKEFPVSILDIQKEDTSTSEDYVYTYTVKCEDYSGKRFTLKFDIPKFRNNRFSIKENNIKNKSKF